MNRARAVEIARHINAHTDVHGMVAIPHLWDARGHGDFGVRVETPDWRLSRVIDDAWLAILDVLKADASTQAKPTTMEDREPMNTDEYRNFLTMQGGPARVRKRPIEVTAMYFDGSIECALAIRDWAGLAIGFSPAYGGETGPKGQLLIQTLEGDMAANADTWIIRGMAGEFYPCAPHIFRETYEVIEDTPLAAP